MARLLRSQIAGQRCARCCHRWPKGELQPCTVGRRRGERCGETPGDARLRRVWTCMVLAMWCKSPQSIWVSVDLRTLPFQAPYIDTFSLSHVIYSTLGLLMLPVIKVWLLTNPACCHVMELTARLENQKLTELWNSFLMTCGDPGSVHALWNQ